MMFVWKGSFLFVSSDYGWKFSLMQSIGSLQKKYSIGSFELLSKTAPIQSISLLVLGPFIDYFLNGKFITNYKLSSGAIVRTNLTIHMLFLIDY